jgi:hypothetical protein
MTEQQQPPPSRVVPEELLRMRAAQMYDQATAQREAQVIQWLQTTNGGRLMVQVQKWLNSTLVNALKAAVKRAVEARAWSISFNIQVDKLSRKMLSNAPPQAQQAIPLDMLNMALILLAEDAGYVIENGKIIFDLSLEPIIEDVELEEEEEDEDATAIEGAEPAGLPGPPEGDGFDDLESEIDADLNGGLANGQIHANAKNSIHRRIDDIVDGTVHYTVVASQSAQVAVGSTGTVAASSFRKWSAGIVE